MNLTKSIAAAALALSVSVGTVSAQNIVETAMSAGKFETLIAAAKAAGLAGALSGDGPLTVFAPTDDAFAKLAPGTVETLLKPENKDQLVSILTYHVVGRKLTSNMLPGRTIHVKPLNDTKRLAVTKSGAEVTINDANVVTADIKTDNGYIHIIDTVLIPGS